MLHLSFTACVYQNMFLVTAFFFCFPANPKSKLTKFKLQKNQNLTQQYFKCHQEVAKNMSITKSSNMQSSSTLKVSSITILKFAFNWYSVASLHNSSKNVYDTVA